MEWRPAFLVDARLALSVHRRGGGDPTYRVDTDGSVWRTCLTPDGPGTIRVSQRGGTVTADAWGPGGQWLLDGVPDLLGASDDPSRLRAEGLVAAIASAYPGLRIGRSRRVFEALVPAVLEQKVVGKEAHRAWRTLLYQHGSPAPGPAPAGMRVFPPPRVWVRIPSWDWHRAGVEGVRVRTIIGAAAVASRLESLSAAAADAALRSLPGIGVWTSAEIRQRAFGDPDAISVGDYNLPKRVGWTLRAERDGDDDLMLELLRPYEGQRYRVQRLVELGGSSPPRRGPRMPVRDYRAF